MPTPGMRINSETLRALPDACGAYFLYRGSEPLYAGIAAGGTTVRTELLAHLRGDFGAPTREATHFSWQETASVEKAYDMQLDAHARWDVRAPAAGCAPPARR